MKQYCESLKREKDSALCRAEDAESRAEEADKQLEEAVEVVPLSLSLPLT